LAERRAVSPKEENWDLEVKARPEPAFNLPNSTPSQQKPKQSYLKFLKTLHGRETAAKARKELNYLKVTKTNFHQWREESLRQAIYKMENPPENLLHHH